MEPPTGYNWPTTIENGSISGNTITSDVVNESNTDENGIMTVTVTCVEATIAVTGMTLDPPTSLTVAANSHDSIRATIEPPNATNKTINWSSSKPTVATVTSSTTSGQNATVTWKKAGSCTITATADGDASKSATCTVTCEEARVTNISLTPPSSSLELDANGTTTISATVSPSYATNQAIYWESSDTSVATVTTHTMSGNNATITWQGPGTCDITAKADNGRISKKCSVKCNAATVAVTGITLTPTTLNIDANGSTTITATIEPPNATTTSINWKTSNASVAKVTSYTVIAGGEKATVTWQGAGECTITATAAGNTSKTATCPVTCASPANNYYIGRSNKEVFTLDDLDQYVAEKPSEITLPGGDNSTTWAVWIYPEAWGKPTKAVSNHSMMDEISSFIYEELTIPEGYIGCYSLPGEDDTYTLEW